MILHEDISPPRMVALNREPPQAMIQKMITWKIETEKDLIAFTKEMNKGRDIMMTFKIGEITYVMIRDFAPSKIDTGLLPPGVLNEKN